MEWNKKDYSKNKALRLAEEVNPEFDKLGVSTREFLPFNRSELLDRSNSEVSDFTNKGYQEVDLLEDRRRALADNLIKRAKIDDTNLTKEAKSPVKKAFVRKLGQEYSAYDTLKNNVMHTLAEKAKEAKRLGQPSEELLQNLNFVKRDNRIRDALRSVIKSKLRIVPVIGGGLAALSALQSGDVAAAGLDYAVPGGVEGLGEGSDNPRRMMEIDNMKKFRSPEVLKSGESASEDLDKLLALKDKDIISPEEDAIAFQRIKDALAGRQLASEDIEADTVARPTINEPTIKDEAIFRKLLEELNKQK